MKDRSEVPWRGLVVIDLRNGDIVHYLRLEGAGTELFDVAVIPEVRCPRGVGPEAGEMAELVRGEKMDPHVATAMSQDADGKLTGEFA